MLLQNEVRDIILEEIVDFLDGYIVMHSIVHGGITTELVPQKSIKFISSWYNQYYNSSCKYEKHSVVRAGRTKVRFCFSFEKDELDFAIKLNRLLDGYVDYGFSDGRNYNYSFTIDTGSKQSCVELFDKLSLIEG